MTRRWLIELMLTITCWAMAAVLFGLQLTGYIDLPWWWITAPLWAPVAVALGGFAGLALFQRLRPLKS